MKLRKIALIAGSCLILVSLLLMLGVQLRQHTGARKRQAVLQQMEVAIPETTPGIQGMEPEIQMPVLQIEGTDYVAALEIPAYGITLPVSDRWSEKHLLINPSRFCGSAYDGTLVIGGADTQGQFAFCDQIQQGAQITLTDMTGGEFTYTVSRVDRAKRATSQWLTEGEYDLTLFCRDTYSMTYIAIRCTQIQ